MLPLESCVALISNTGVSLSVILSSFLNELSRLHERPEGTTIWSVLVAPILLSIFLSINQLVCGSHFCKKKRGGGLMFLPICMSGKLLSIRTIYEDASLASRALLLYVIYFSAHLIPLFYIGAHNSGHLNPIRKTQIWRKIWGKYAVLAPFLTLNLPLPVAAY